MEGALMFVTSTTTVVLLGILCGLTSTRGNLTETVCFRGSTDHQLVDARLLGRDMAGVIAVLGLHCDIDSAGPGQYEMTYVELGIRLTLRNDRVIKVERLGIHRSIRRVRGSELR